MKTRIEYTTPYADPRIIDGYVIAEARTGHYAITQRQHRRAIDNLSRAGVNPNYISDMPVLVIGKDIRE